MLELGKQYAGAAKRYFPSVPNPFNPAGEAVDWAEKRSGNSVRKNCRVQSWTTDPKTGDGEIVFVVPPMLPEVCDVVVDPKCFI